MRRIRILVSCLVAALAVAGVVVAGASASTPTWYECGKAAKSGKKYTGKYNNKTCSEPNAMSEGKYELKEGVGKAKAFKGSGGTAELHVKTWLGDQIVECTKSADGGKPALPNLEKEVTVTFSGCTLFKTNECASSGAKAGEIKITGLKGEFGYVEESPVVVGLKLENEVTPGGVIGEFSCKIVDAKLAGELIGVQEKDVNVVNKESTTVFEATERYGEHEYEGKKFKPLVNILGWASEVAEIEKLEKPANVLKGEFCGELVEELLGKPCTPPAYAGQDQTITNKGETLMVKA